MIWLQITATVIVCGAIIVDVVKGNRKPSICDSCRNLQRKNSRSRYWKYECTENYGLDHAPEFCSDYKPRDKEET